MNQLAKQALQFTIPAAMGYALGRHHAVSGSKHETLPAADAVFFSIVVASSVYYPTIS